MAFLEFFSSYYHVLEVSLTPNDSTGFMRLNSYVVARCSQPDFSCF